MKRKIKLTDLTSSEIEKNNLQNIKGGYMEPSWCYCGNKCTCSGNSYQSAQRQSLHNGDKGQ